MKKFVLVVLACLVCVTGIFPNTAMAANRPWPSGPSNVSAEGAIVMDLKSGTILYEKNMDKQLYPASITKIMTTLLALENSSMSEVVTYSYDAVMGLEYGASNASIQPDEQLTMEQSLYCVMIQSANEACLGVAEHISGTVKNFAKAMNEKAKSLGCTGTHFSNPNGLWRKNHYTTPHDMALIMRAAMKNDDFRTICNTKRYDVQKTNKTKTVRNLVNHHAMIFSLNYPKYGYNYCIGGKTGYTSKSGATLVTCAKKGDMELVCVVMNTKSAAQGEPNIYTDTIKLFNYCFEKYKQYNIDQTQASQLSEELLFTKFSPFFASSLTGLRLDGGSVILPRRVSLEKAEKKVEYYPEMQSIDGNNVIGRVSYLYEGKDAGGANIVYNAPTSPTLNDSIDMNKWFEEAVEEASKPAFPWKIIFLLLFLAAIAAAVTTVIIFRAKDYQQKTRGKRHYRKTNKRGKDFFLK